MYLKRIYSNPEGLFQTVKFRNGVNFVYGKKDSISPKESLNSIGKSTFLDLIDFCLLASPYKNHNPRINAASKILDGYEIVLEFEINGETYQIRRSINSPNYISFGPLNNVAGYYYSDLKNVLCDLIFKRNEYEGTFSSKWYRSMISFYLKIQKFKQSKFLDPIKYIKDVSEVELNKYHFYFIGLDNRIPIKNEFLRTEIKRIDPAISEIERFVEEKYDLKNLAETNSEIDRINLEIKRLEKAIRSFELGEQYENAEEEANRLTREIKELVYANHLDRKKIESLEESFTITDDISTIRIRNIYKQLSEDLAQSIKKTLDEAIKFRKQLSKSRASFLENEIEHAQNQIKKRENEIKTLEKKRADLFYFLSAKEAITDLTEAFFNLSDKQSQVRELEANTGLLNELSKEKAEYESEIKKLESELISFLQEYKRQIREFYELMLNIYNAIYTGGKNRLSFSISQNARKKKLVDINISLPDMFGKGKNQGRTLIYDLSVLMNNIDLVSFPNFLIHDGIFDGVDKAHFISVYEFIENIASTKKIQYITTVNEEGTLSERFGSSDIINPNFIDEISILTLTPTNKLFRTEF